MKKYVLIMVVAIVGLVGCDKDKGGGSNNNRYNSYYGNGGYGTGYGNDAYCQGGRGMRYRQVGNGICEDTRNGQQVDFRNCERETYEYERRCGGSGYGYGNGYGYGGGYGGGYGYGYGSGPMTNACSVYNRPGETFVMVYYPNTGQRLCVGMTTFSSYTSGYSLGYWNNVNGVYAGCLPGQPGCLNWGGTLGVYIGAGVRF